MNVIESLTNRNRSFAEGHAFEDLRIMPSKKTMILGCVDPRVDPAEIFDLAPGEAAVIRNVGGRVDPSVLLTMGLLRSVVKARGSDVGLGWHLVVLHHTDCGIIDCHHHAPALLAKQLGISVAELDEAAINNPHAAVALDVAALKANPNLPGGLAVSGIVYDVATGRVEVVVPETLLRSDD
ncbi:carbonic anhydrase [Lichenicoccus sp.]|uniref:carbonic anhydrase n=1 Tax=Lichenicoccus sp. TaxID=2781899 RepID=UPI003D0A53B3